MRKTVCSWRRLTALTMLFVTTCLGFTSAYAQFDGKLNYSEPATLALAVKAKNLRLANIYAEAFAETSPRIHSPFTGRLTISEAVSPVTVVNSESVHTSYGIGDITTIISTLPQTNVVTQTETTVNLRGLGTNRTLVLVDGKRTPLYTQSVNLDMNNIPISAIESIEVLKDGASAVYGSDAVSGVVNFITRQDMEGRIESNMYKPFYTLPIINYSGAQNDLYGSFRLQHSQVFTAAPGLSTVPDNSYGSGGTIQINLTPYDDYRLQEIKYFDPGGIYRQTNTIEWYPQFANLTEKKYFDCNNNPVHYSLGFTDKTGTPFSFYDMNFRKRQPEQAYRYAHDNYAYRNIRLNFDPDDWTYDSYRAFSSQSGYVPERECNPCPRNVIYGGFSYILEDFSDEEKLGMPGIFVKYTWMFSQNFGASAYVAYNTGKKDPITYTKLSLLGGVSYTPFEGANCDDNFIFTTYLLGGIADQTQKYMNFKFSDSYFTIMAGATGAHQFNDHVGARVAAFYSPTFAEGNTAKNFTFLGGIRYTF